MQPRATAARGARRVDRLQRGAAILLILLIAMTVGLALLFGSSSSGGRFLRQQKTLDSLATAKSALVGYAASYPEQVNPDRVWGYLPCTDTNNSGTQNVAGCSDTITPPEKNRLGRYPHKTLGLDALRDSAGECLWYAVSDAYKLTNDDSVNFPMNWDARGNLRIADPSGSVLVDPANNSDPSGGAVAALFAPGPPLPTQARSGGTNQCPGDTTNGLTDWIDDGSYAAVVNGTLTVRQGTPGSNTNNDQIGWITSTELWDTIGRRADLYTKINGTMIQVRDCLNAQSSLPVPAGLVDNGPTDPKQHVKANALVLPACALSAFNQDLWDNWRDQIRYVRCKANGVNCLTVNGTACEGALVFGGRHIAGRPRTNTEKSDPALPAAPSLQIVSYFEGANAASLTSDGTNFADALPAFGPNAQSSDTAYCLDSLATSTPITFADPVTTTVATSSDLANFDSGTLVLTLGAANFDSGDVGGDFGQLFGCAWIGNPTPINNGFRAVFRYLIDRRGPGFTFTAADADPASNPTASMCGGGGRFLGYAGTPNQAGVVSIKPPKLAIEIDTEDTLADRNDPNENHIAAVFWGGSRPDPDDDNVHGALGTAGDPSNLAVFSNVTIRDQDVERALRIELHANASDYDGSTATMTLKVWYENSDPLVFPPNGFLNTSADYSDPTDPPNLTQIFTVDNVLPGKRPFDSLRFGFTGANGIGDQLINISNLEIRAR